VQGTHAYRVRLGVDAGGQVECSCSCPAAADGAWCKHCVAVGLRWLHGDPGDADPGEELREYLHGLGVDGLVDLVLEQAGTDQRFGERLSARALRAVDGPVDLGSVRALLDRAMRVRGHVDYREAWGFFQAVDEAIDVVADLDGVFAQLDDLAGVPFFQQADGCDGREGRRLRRRHDGGPGTPGGASPHGVRELSGRSGRPGRAPVLDGDGQ
jgi:uncharacterized Zn finger protein